MREEELGDRLGQILKDIHIPDDILVQLQRALLNDKGREEEVRRQQGERLTQRLSQVQRRLDQAYQDKLDGKISEEFWMRKSGEWQAEENQIRTSMQGLEMVRPERLLDAAKILELANKAHFLYFTRNQAERGQLLKSVLLNCDTDGVNLWPVYRKPFDLIFERARTKEWSGREDLNLIPTGPETKGANSGGKIERSRQPPWPQPQDYPFLFSKCSPK